MKKTLFLLLALPGIALAEDAGSVGDSSTTRTLELTSYEVSFEKKKDGTVEESKTLDTGNALMSWHSTTVGEQPVSDAYTFWFMTFSITHAIKVKEDGSKVSGGPTITTNDATDTARGLSARVICDPTSNVVQPNIGIGNGNDLISSTLNFTSGTDVLTFAYYNGTAYIGNITTASYISYDVSGIPNLDTQMNSGASRAWSNQDTTKIGATTIASLDNIGLAENETLDMAKLMTTGVAVATLTFASSVTGSGDISMTVDDGQSGDAYSAAFGTSTGTDNNDLKHTGNITMTYADDYAGTGTATGNGTTAFGVVNVGEVTGNVGLTFSAENATYGTFSDTNAVSVAGGYKGSIGGTFTATINAGTFNYDILGGLHSADDGDSIGATSIVINGGTIKGNVYGGGFAGKIVGDTAVTIVGNSGLAALKGGVLSAGGTGGSIGGNSTLTFSNIGTQDAPLSYTGSVEGSSGATVTGSTALEVVNSHLSLVTVKDFDTINIADGSSLKITGAITTDAILNISYDADTVANKKDNGLGAGVFSGLVTGDGEFAVEDGVTTLNGKVITGTNGRDFLVDNAVYYVVDSTVLEAPPADTPKAPRVGAVYSLGNGYEILESSVVNVGTHNYSAPKATEGANEALGYYVGGDGTLCIMADVSPTKTAGQILQSVQGNGNIILRTASYENQDGSRPLMHVYVNGKTQVTGELYLAPYYVGASNGSMNFQPGVILELQEGADISSFSAVYMCYPESAIALNGTLGRSSEDVGHINNLQAYGSSFTYLYVNKNTNDTIVLGGDTVLQPYEHGAGGLAGAHLTVVANKDNSTINIEHLVGNEAKSSLTFRSDLDDLYEKDEAVNSTLNIESFDYRGYIYLQSTNEGDSISLNINLESEQYIQDSQLTWTLSVASTNSVYNGSVTVTLTGSGKYVLSDGNAIYMGPSKDYSGEFQKNFAKLSDDWTGTVEVNNLNATGKNETGGNTKIQGIKIADYGNENSTIHFKGFNGYLTDSETEVVIKSDLIIADGESLKGYEISGGAADQKQTYTGAISGTGDFVVSADGKQAINLQGDLSGWKDGAKLKVTAGEHAVTFSGDACEVNAGVSASGGALHMTVSTEKGTTFTKSVDVTSLTVSGGSVANLQATTTAGNVQVDSRGGIAAKLSKGLTIKESSVSSGAIENAKITARDITKTVELADLEATNLYLYGKDVSFHSAEDEKQFEYEPMTYDLQTANEVVYTTDIFKGMTLSKDGAQLTLSVLDAVVGTGDPGADMTNVTIFLEGFTIEELAGTSGKWIWKKQANTSGDWSWTEHGLTLVAADSQVALMSADPSVTVTDLLNAQYKFVTYKQNPQGLTIRMSNIPEPATATLSLLALAALAARRRRK